FTFANTHVGRIFLLVLFIIVYLVILLVFLFFLMIRPPPSSTLFPYTTLFRSNRELLSEVKDLEVVRADFEAARCALVLDDPAVHDDGGFDERLLCRSKCRRGHAVAGDCDLHNPGRVADHDERLASDRPSAVDPASQLDGLARVESFQDFLDRNHELPPYLAGSRLPFRGRQRE